MATESILNLIHVGMDWILLALFDLEHGRVLETEIIVLLGAKENALPKTTQKKDNTAMSICIAPMFVMSARAIMVL